MKTALFPLTTLRQFAWLCTLALALPVGAAQFEDVTVAAGLTRTTGLCTGVAWGDYNNDGNIDLYISVGSGLQINALYRNAGDGTFTRVGSEAGHITTDRGIHSVAPGSTSITTASRICSSTAAVGAAHAMTFTGTRARGSSRMVRPRA